MRELHNVLDDDYFWTIDRAAKHLGFTRATIARYIREGLPIYFRALGGRVHRDELLAEVRKRESRQRATRAKKIAP